MRILIVEDDQASRLVLAKYLESVGEVSMAEDGEAGLEAFRTALTEKSPYQLVCLDIMMPKLDGQAVLKGIRALEGEHAVARGKESKVIMTTALGDKENVVEAIPRCDAYLTKPIDRTQLMFYVKKFGLLSPDDAQRIASKTAKRPDEKPWGHKDKDMPWVG
jgi:two-component system chemotaxis response regulator CheY